MKYVCSICGYVYDEEKEGVPFEQLPSDWKCPRCGVPKQEFRAEEAEETPSAATPGVLERPEEGDAFEGDGEGSLTRLTPGELAAVCSNLARGCEKQYRPEEQALFLRLSKYFEGVSPRVENAAAEKLSEALQRDIDAYPALRKAADEAGDRGAARVCVWGEKVTRMLSFLVGRYLREGEKMLEGTEIWVCSVCGFVYIGETPPEPCPVCKVPAWKFEKISGRKAV